MKKNILLSAFSGLLLWIAWPPTHYTTFLLFVGLVPMLVAVENIIRSNYTKKGKKIFGTVFLGFFVWNTLSIYWVYNSLKTVGEVVAVPISLIPYSLGPILMATGLLAVLQVTTHHQPGHKFIWPGLLLGSVRIFTPNLGTGLPLDDPWKWLRDNPSMGAMV